MPENQAMFDDGRRTTYAATTHERAWLRSSLQEFYDDQWFTDVLYMAKGGKEATVYCCRAQPEAGMPLVAAKVFRPTMFRAMRNDWFYKQGRTAVGLDGKSIYRGKELRAVKQASRYARQVHTASWCAHEHAVLQRLHEAGADVPRPLAHADNAILMEFIGDERGAAPTLQTVDLPRPRAHELLESLLWNVGLMLGQNLIHADLSAYNVLWWDDRGVIIDLPQAVSADSHPGAWALLHRDVDRLCRYFGAQGVECDAISLTQDLWRRWMG